MRRMSDTARQLHQERRLNERERKTARKRARAEKYGTGPIRIIY
jgi:hypothetical protein